jgi:hypothetical protein
MPGGDLAELRRIWQQAGRTGAAKLKDAAKRQGLNLAVKEVKEFVIGDGCEPGLPASTALGRENHEPRVEREVDGRLD